MPFRPDATSSGRKMTRKSTTVPAMIHIAMVATVSCLGTMSPTQAGSNGPVDFKATVVRTHVPVFRLTTFEDRSIVPERKWGRGLYLRLSDGGYATGSRIRLPGGEHAVVFSLAAMRGSIPQLCDRNGACRPLQVARLDRVILPNQDAATLESRCKLPCTSSRPGLACWARLK